MKSKKIAITIGAIICSALPLPLFAGSPLEREYQTLREQHEKALAATAEPINRRYQATLEQLLRRATQGNELETALKIKAEIKQLGLSNPSPGNIKQGFESTVWGFRNSGTFEGAPNPKITFKANGKVSTEPAVEWISGWETAGNRLKLFQRNRNLYWIFIIEPSGTRSVSDPTLGTIHEVRSLELIPPVP